MSCIMLVLTFIYISFTKIFCQNKIKKNCKYVSRMFLGNAGNCREWKSVRHL